MEYFGEATRAWFEESFRAPTEVQWRGWAAIARGEHALLVAPTGSGKTLAAFLWGLDRLSRLPPDGDALVRLLYVSPLKALVYDVERNLRAPLVGIQRSAERLGQVPRALRVAVRTGDTPQRERRLLVREPAEILVTTPESLYLLLGAEARTVLRGVQAVIVDEVHALAPAKRGAHLALCLERLSELCTVEPQRIGLSATVRPLEEVARYLGGERPVTVVDAAAAPLLDLQVRVPVPDMTRVPPPPALSRGGPILGQLQAEAAPPPAPERGVWPAIYPALLAEIRARRSTIVFVNSRGLCERLAQRLNELAGEELVLAHHGSVSHAQRAAIETDLKAGRVRGIVATSSLELGIDMGAVDLVLLVESPGSVARGLQRVGRAGHQVGAVSVARIFPKFRGDLLECALIGREMLSGEIEALRVPQNALDVLAQQLVAICCVRPRPVADLSRLVRRAYPFHGLSEAALTAVLEMLSGHYPSSAFAELRPLLAWDRQRDLVSARRGAALVARLNAGTIPDRGNYGVHVGADGPRVGELDEEMVFETRPGENILLGASAWRVEEITRDRVIVAPAPGEPGRLPFWRGEGPGRPVALGRALGAFVRDLGAVPAPERADWLQRQAPLDAYAARNLAAYVEEQKLHTGTLPTDRALTVERFRDELGDWRVCILSPFGARVHAPWAMAVQEALSGQYGFEVQVMYTDDGIVLRFADVEELPALEALLPDPDELEERLARQLPATALFAGLFRENAARSLLMPRRQGGRRSPLWAQRLKAQTLLAEVRRYPDFPVVLETYRQALGDVFDLPGLKDLLRQIRARRIRVVEVETRSASPFARSLVFAYVAAYIYEQDAPLAERKAQALTLDRRLLGELLGQAELRELIDPLVLAELEAELQRLGPEQAARDADELHDLLRRLGDLNAVELGARGGVEAPAWLERLQQERRAIVLRIAGETRWVAAEDAGRYRDALGCVPPPGLPDRYLGPAAEPLEWLLHRFARRHGPFLSREAARRFGLLPAQVEPALRRLEAAGVLVRGELRPAGVEPEWCEVEVLRRLKRRTLARLRQAAAPVDGAVFARFLADWHGLEQPRGEALLEAVTRLEGLALPWSVLSQTLLPQRVADFGLEALDIASATGVLVWVGAGALGPRDGRVALYRREHVARLLVPQAQVPATAVHAALLAVLAERGASFLTTLEAAARVAAPGLGRAEFEAALWDLVWAGQVTNDTCAPLRALGRSGAGRPARRGVDALAGGRWSLVSQLLEPRTTPTEHTLALAEMLLDRYGVVSREAAQAEQIPGGFGPLYRVLKAAEEAGRVRRGYFVEGLSGAQFARPGAVDALRRWRGEGDEDDAAGAPAVCIAALDPANPYGALLPWPVGASESLRPRRVAEAWVILVSGRPVLYVGPGGRALLSFPDGLGTASLEAAFEMLGRMPRGRRRGVLVVESIDGVPVQESPHAATLRACGFQSDYRGFIPAP